MANGQDPILDEFDRVLKTTRGSGSATAVADPVEAEFDRVAGSGRSGRSAPVAPSPEHYQFSPPRSFEESEAQEEVGPPQRGVSADEALKNQIEADRATAEAEDEGERATHGGSTAEESEAASRRVTRPFAMPEQPSLLGRSQTASPLTLQGPEFQQPDYGTSRPVVPGNIQWYGRPKVKPPKGTMTPEGYEASYGTVHSVSFKDEDGLEVLVPTIYDGKWHGDKEAWEHYKQTGQHMGKFRTPADADAFAIKYHNDAAQGKYDVVPGTAERPHAVRGPFGQPVPPISVEAAMQKQEEDRQRAQIAKEEARARQVEEEEHQRSMGPAGRFAVEVLKNVENAYTQLPERLPHGEGTFLPAAEAYKNVSRAVSPLSFEALSVLPEPGLPVEQRMNKAILGSVGQLVNPTNIALAAGMEALPPTFVSSAAAKVIMGAGFTVPMAVGLIHSSKQAADALKKEDWESLVEIAGSEAPNIVFTAEGLRNIYEGIAQGVNLTKNWMNLREARAQARTEARRAEVERLGRLLPPGEAEAPAGPTVEPGPQPAPETPPEAPPARQRARRKAKATALEPEVQPTEETAPERPGMPSEPEPRPSSAEIEDLRQETGLPLTEEAATRRIRERTDLPQKLAEAPREEPPAGESIAAPQAEIARYHNEEEGTESTVTKTPRGFAVNLRDTESGNDLGVVRIFDDKTKALNHAQNLVGRFENIPPESTEEAPITFSKDTTGIQWAERGGVRVSIPKGVNAADREAYAREKLAEQEEGQARIRAALPEVPTLNLEDEADRLTYEANQAVREGDDEKAFQLRQQRDAIQAERQQPIDVVFTDQGNVVAPPGQAKIRAALPEEPSFAPSTKAKRQRAQPEPLAESIFPQDVIAEAKQELIEADDKWQAFERPGRYVHDVGYEPGMMGNRPEMQAYGIPSARPHLEAAHPWIKRLPKLTAGKMREAINRGKGAEYNRMLTEAAQTITQERESSRAVIDEFAPRMMELAAQVRDIDPELADRLKEFSNGNTLRGLRNLRDYAQRNIADADTAIAFRDAVDRAAEEAGAVGETGAQETSGDVDEPREDEGVLPGFGQTVREEREAVGRERGRQLTERINEPAESIESAAGELESRSPLFRGTTASPQEEMFARRSASPTRTEYDQLEQAMSEQALGRPPQFPSYQEVLDERAKPGVDEAESLRQTVERLMGQERQSGLEGPGTPAVGQFDPTESPLRELTKSVERVANPSDNVSERIRNAVDIARVKGRARDAVTATFGNVKAAAVAINDYLRRPPEQTDFKDALKNYQGGVQKSAHEIRGFMKQFRRAVPDKAIRDAMGAFIEAGENRDTLRRWAYKSTGDAKTVYEKALKLTDEQKTIARNVHQFQEDRAQFAIDQGIMEHAVENYLMHVWDRPTKFTNQMINLVKTRMLQPNPSFAKRRIFPTIFDGEQAGFKPTSRDMGDLAAAHEYALNEAVLARGFIRSLLDGKEKDGRPLAAVSGFGSAIPKDSINKEAYFINSHLKPEEIKDYRAIDHPALRSWKWATSDSDGNPIFVKGDIVVHPDSWRTLSNVLGRSALRQWEIPGTAIRPAKAALELGREFKSTLLSLSGFHQTQEAVHALEYRVNPANLVKLDFSNNEQWKLVRGGLQIASFNQQQLFSEGVSGSGLVNRIPGVGPLLQTYQDYLFSDYIPRLKMTMALHAFERNKARYGTKLSADQLYELTANQANAAFGELNYTMLGRNKTFQDVLRLTLLAPDFLEARGRFVGQAAKPWGREQLIALALGALALYVGARILNQFLDDDPHWEPQDAFNVIHNKKTYTLRTVQGDIEHLLSDPRSFVYNRLNPIYGRGMVEAVTGRDKYGRKRGAMDQIADLVHELVPIPAQGRLKSIPETPSETVLTSMGISSYPYETAAEKLAKEYAMEQLPTGERSEAQVKSSRKASELVQNIRSGKQSRDELDKAFAKREISRGQYESALRELQQSALETDVQRLGLGQVLNVYDKATTVEKSELLPQVLSRVHRVVESDSESRAELEPRVTKILRETGNQDFIPSQVDEELARLGYQGLRSTDAVERELKDGQDQYVFSPEERLEYQTLRGRTAREFLSDVIRDSNYSRLPDAEKLAELKSAVQEAHKLSKDEMTARIVERHFSMPQEPEFRTGAP